MACGGFKCIKPGVKNKNEKSEKCGLGDTFMQCVYQKIDTKVDCNKIKTMRKKSIYFRFFSFSRMGCVSSSSSCKIMAMKLKLKEIHILSGAFRFPLNFQFPHFFHRRTIGRSIYFP